MTTCSDLLDEITAQLHGWGSTRDRVTSLTNTIGATDLTFTVDATFGQAVGISPGIVEIGSEQIYVSSVDANTNICSVAPFGRGYNDTTATTHSAGAKITTSPRFPRIDLFKQVNEILGSVYPDLFAVNTYTGTLAALSNTYNLGSTKGTPLEVIDAQWQDPIGNWYSFPSYKIDPYDGSFRHGSGGWPGRPMRVLYKTQPGLFTAETDDFAAVTGLPASCVDVITTGAVAKQVPALDISRAQLSSVEQSDRSRIVPPFAGVNASKYLMALFQDRLHNEAQSLRKQYPTRIVRTW